MTDNLPTSTKWGNFQKGQQVTVHTAPPGRQHPAMAHCGAFAGLNRSETGRWFIQLAIEGDRPVFGGKSGGVVVGWKRGDTIQSVPAENVNRIEKAR